MRLPVVPGGIRAKAWPPVLATRGPGSQSNLHSHHAMHFVLAVDGDIGVRTSDSGHWSRAQGVLSAPDVLHAVDAVDVEILLIFMDPESDAGAMFQQAFDGPLRLIDSSERAALIRGADPSDLVRDGADEWSRSAAGILGLKPTNGRRPVHPRVRKLLSLLQNGQFEEEASLDVLAEAVGLSSSRLMHVFTESIGIPIRPYLSWLRIQRAAAAIVSGKASLTEAAHQAGFADAAHMSRSFKRALGVAPSALRPLRCSGQSVQDD